MDDRIYAGAAWKKETKDGKAFLSISIDLEKFSEVLDLVGEDKNVNMVMFENNRKKHDKSPDYNIIWFPKS